MSLISGFLSRLQVFKTVTCIFFNVLLFQLQDVLSSSQSFKVWVLYWETDNYYNGAFNIYFQFQKSSFEFWSATLSLERSFACPQFMYNIHTVYIRIIKGNPNVQRFFNEAGCSTDVIQCCGGEVTEGKVCCNVMVEIRKWNQ